MLERIQQEWAAMQEDIEREEKEKYEQMVNESSRKLEEEARRLRKQNDEKISQLKIELLKKIEGEEIAGEENLEAVKKSNKEKVNEEEQKLKQELVALSQSLKGEIKKLEEKSDKELNDKKEELENKIKNEIKELKKSHDTELQNIQEAHVAELAALENKHQENIAKIQETYRKEEDEANSERSKSKDINKENLEQQKTQLDMKIKDEEKNYHNLLNEIESVRKEICSENDALKELKEKTAAAQSYFDEIQEEIDKTENDLDLLRAEKSGLISELNILKENINNEKSNLLNLEQKHKSPKQQNPANLKIERGINTDIEPVETLCKTSQVDIDYMDASCQANILVPTEHASCQTFERITASKTCQVDFISHSEDEVIVNKPKENTDPNAAIHKSLENALNNISSKMDTRINVIEQHLKSLQENLKSNSHYQHTFTGVDSSKIPEFLYARPILNPTDHATCQDSSVNRGFFIDSMHKNIPGPSTKKCMCEHGDPASCEVMQDVKKSIYGLNDILNSSFVPSLDKNNTLYDYNHSSAHYSSPLENFYVQFRELQEKHRIMDLKHKCENETTKLYKTDSSSTASSVYGSKNFLSSSNKEYLKPSHHLLPTNLYHINLPDNPLLRARAVVLREQARSWKQGHSELNSSSFQSVFKTENRIPSSPHSISSNMTAALNEVSPLADSFFDFEPDPESDYNIWMTRLNALQQKIRSHKML